MNLIDHTKVKNLIIEFFHLAELRDQPEEAEVDQLLKLIQAHTALDMIDLLTESEETKVKIKSGEIQEAQAVELLKKDIQPGIAEDVYMASLQRHLELALREFQSEIDETRHEELERFIAQIDKEELRPDAAPQSQTTAAAPAEQVEQPVPSEPTTEQPAAPTPAAPPTQVTQPEVPQPPAATPPTPTPT